MLKHENAAILCYRHKTYVLGRDNATVEPHVPHTAACFAAFSYNSELYGLLLTDEISFVPLKRGGRPLLLHGQTLFTNFHKNDKACWKCRTAADCRLTAVTEADPTKAMPNKTAAKGDDVGSSQEATNTSDEASDDVD